MKLNFYKEFECTVEDIKPRELLLRKLQFKELIYFEFECTLCITIKCLRCREFWQISVIQMDGACFYILKRSVVMLKLESSGFAAASAMPYRRRHSNSRSRLLKKIVNKAPLNTMGSLLSVILPILQRIWLVKMGNKNALKALLCVQMTQNHNGSGQVAQMFVFVQK